MRKILSEMMAVILMTGMVVSGCSTKEKQEPVKETSEASKATAASATEKTVATVGGQAITVEDLENYLAMRPIPRHARNADNMLKERLDELVTEELLYQAALKEKLDQDPEVRRKIKRLLNQEFLEKKINREFQERKIGPDELRAYYDAHSDEFNRPAQVRVADIFVAVPPDAGKEKRAGLKQKAEGILAELMKMTNKRAGFAQLARKYSDTPTTHQRGDTGFFDQEGKPAGVDPKIVEAAFALEKSGDISQTVVEAADGFHIIMQTGKRSAFNRPFEQVARHLERRIRNEQMKAKRDEYLEQAKKDVAVVIEEKALASVLENMKSASSAVSARRGSRPTHAMPPHPPIPPSATGMPMSAPGEREAK